MRPELKVLNFVSDCDDRHIALVQKVCEGMLDKPSIFNVIELRDRGVYSFWEVGNASALIITCNQISGAGNELYLVGVAGTGIIGAAADIISDLRTIAREFGCRYVSGLGIREGWVDFALSHGFRKVATYYTMDLEMN